MELKEAIELIRFKPSDYKGQVWADLGCGSGLFTKALASLLPAPSLIHAIDKDINLLDKIPANFNGIDIEKSADDFLSGDVFFPEMDGLLMANSLHFVPDKQSFLRTKFESLRDGGLFLLVEYDLKTANSWVPYPVTIDEAELYLKDAGFRSFKVLGKKASIYGSRYMYGALVKK